MDGSVETPLRRVEAEAADHLELESLLGFEREADAAERPLTFGAGGRDERHLLLLELVEDLTHLRRLHPGLEVVQEHVVGLVVVVEALDVAAAEVEVVPQGRQELREVGLLARLHPDGHRERGGAAHLGAQLGGHPASLLPVAADDADQAGLVRVVVERLLVRCELVEQPAHLVGRERLVLRSARSWRAARPGRRRRRAASSPAGPSRAATTPCRDPRSRRRAPSGLQMPSASRATVPVWQPTAANPSTVGEARAPKPTHAASGVLARIGICFRRSRFCLRPKAMQAGRRGSSEDDLPLRSAGLRCRRRTGSESDAGRARTRRIKD